MSSKTWFVSDTDLTRAMTALQYSFVRDHHHTQPVPLRAQVQPPLPPSSLTNPAATQQSWQQDIRNRSGTFNPHCSCWHYTVLQDTGHFPHRNWLINVEQLRGKLYQKCSCENPFCLLSQHHASIHTHQCRKRG